MKIHLQQLILVAVFSTHSSFALLSADAALVYTQDSTFPGLFNGWTSSAATGLAANQAWSTFDDFQLAGAANVQKLVWQGFYLGNSSNLPNTVDWNLKIYANKMVNGVDVPDFSNQKASHVALGSNVPRDGQGFGLLANGAQVLVYDFNVIINNFFSAAANTKYWLNIESLSATNDPVWAWTSGDPGNGTSLQQQEGSTGFFQRSGDRAFALFNDTNPVLSGPNSLEDPDPMGGLDLSGSGGFTSVPEPSSWIMFGMLGIGFSLMQLVRSRRR